MPQASVNGDVIHYTDQGSGTPLVLVHGFPLDCRIWARQAEALSKTCRVITVDLPGFGQSRTARKFTIESLADSVHGLFEQIDALPCVLGGLSMGGYVLLAYVTKYPLDLKGLILVDTRCEADTPEGKAGRDKMIEAVRSGGAKAIADQMEPKMLKDGENHPQVSGLLRQIMEACPPQTIENALVAMRKREDYRDKLASIAVPTLVIVGDCDVITPPSMALGMQKGIPNAKMVVIKDAGHVSTMGQAQHVTDAIADFLADI